MIMRKTRGKHLIQEEVPLPYSLLRMNNSKKCQFQLNNNLKLFETYPSIKPQINKCYHENATEWISEEMPRYGFKAIDENITIRSIKDPYSEVLKKAFYKVPRAKIVNYCKDRKPAEESGQWGKKMDNTVYWETATPYDLMRLQNCKVYDFTECEVYPSIRPTRFKCNPQMTAHSLYNTIEDVSCEHCFNREQEDSLEIWRQCPRKETLSFYGIASRIQKPEAILFNRLISKCVKKAGEPMQKRIAGSPAPPKTSRKALEPPMSPCGMVLNRQNLETKVAQMPTVLKMLNQQSLTNWQYCSQNKKNSPPFIEDPIKSSPVPLKVAIGMESQAIEEKQRQEKYVYCEQLCGISENKCTDYEGWKYQPKPEDIDKAYKEIKQSEETVKPEPKDYEELYDELVNCFDKKPCDQDMQHYLDCCSDGKGDGDKGGGDGDDDSYISEGLGDVGSGDGGGDGDGDGDKSKDKEDTDGGDKDDKHGKGSKGDKGDKNGKRDKDDKSGKDDKSHEDGKVIPERPSEPSELLDEADTEKVSEEPEEETIPPKPKNKIKKPKRQAKKKRDGNTKDCPCDICKFMNKRKHEPDTPLISKLKQEEKRRKLKDYLKIMCHRQCKQNSECRAPLHKCDDIDCDNCFCCNPKLGDYCECLNAMQQLQDLLAPNECPELRALKDRICTRLCECL